MVPFPVPFPFLFLFLFFFPVPFPVPSSSSSSLPLPLLLFFSSLARPAIGSQSKVTQQETPGSMYNQDMGKYGTIPDQRPCMNR